MIITLLLFLIISFGFYFFYPRQKTISYFRESDNIEFHDGDLVLRRGKSFVSRVVILGDKKSEYSHVGIIALRNGEPYVVHAVPGEADVNEPEYVKMESVKEFLNTEKSADFAVYSLNEKYRSQGEAAAGKAIEYFDKHYTFDKSFDLEDDLRLYCTELIWKAYQAAGIDLVDQFNVLKTPVYKGDFIYPSNLFLNPVFNKAYPIN